MRMKDQVAGPGVQDTDQTDLPADITRIKRELLCGISRSLKEQGVQGLLDANAPDYATQKAA